MARVLPNLAAENEELKRRLAALEAEQAAAVKFRVSPKGAVSVYGLQRWPVTLYAGQWATLFGQMDKLKAFIREHQSELATKE